MVISITELVFMFLMNNLIIGITARFPEEKTNKKQGTKSEYLLCCANVSNCIIP